jgi:hypothetical protein
MTAPSSPRVLFFESPRRDYEPIFPSDVVYANPLRRSSEGWFAIDEPADVELVAVPAAAVVVEFERPKLPLPPVSRTTVSYDVLMPPPSVRSADLTAPIDHKPAKPRLPCGACGGTFVSASSLHKHYASGKHSDNIWKWNKAERYCGNRCRMIPPECGMVTREEHATRRQAALSLPGQLSRGVCDVCGGLVAFRYSPQPASK